MPVKVGLISLGCAKNLVDSEVMLGLLNKADFIITSEYGDAEVLIVNTCGFINTAKEESINTIVEASKHKDRGNCQLLVVVGCLVQKYQQELSNEIPEVDVWLGTDQTEQIVQILQNALVGNKIVQISSDPSYIYQQAMPRLSAVKHSAYLKIAEGCNNLCSYCIIPQMRGKYRSRTIEAIFSEAVELVSEGAVELILIAQDTTMYGIDLYGELKLYALLEKLLEITELKWIRLLYCYPTHFDERVIELMKKEERICNYLDIPLQHADNEILKKMNRKSSQENIYSLMAKLRKAMPDIALRTTFIVGFPGETIAHFNNLLSFIKQASFNWVGVFPYSQEQDTPAFYLENQVAEEVKYRRVSEVLKIQQQITAKHNEKYLHQKLLVLVEGISEDNQELFYGRTQYQAPEVDGVTFFTAISSPRIGEFIMVKITHIDNYDLIGEMVP